MDNRGRSALGLCHPKFDIAALLRSFDNATVVRCGWLDNFFNPKGARNAQRLLDLPKPKFIRVHIINGPGLNNKRPQPHEITAGETNESLVKKLLKGEKRFLAKFRARLEAVKALTEKATATGSLELAISPWLEHAPIPEKAFRVLAEQVEDILPHALIVDNPVRGGFLRGFLREKHGFDPGPCDIVDLDGVDYRDVDLPTYAKKYGKCKACFIWGYGENGIEPGKPWLPPQKRSVFTLRSENKLFRAFVAPDYV